MRRKAEKIPGGLGKGKKPSDFDPKQIEMGIKIEMEHTEDASIAEEIAMDHLTEDPEYYTHLTEMEKKYEGGGEESEKGMTKKARLREVKKKLILLAMENPKLGPMVLLRLQPDYGSRKPGPPPWAEPGQEPEQEQEQQGLGRGQGLGCPLRNLQASEEIKTPHKKEILSLFQKSKIVDTDVHGLADKLGVPHDQLEGEIYELFRKTLSGK